MSQTPYSAFLNDIGLLLDPVMLPQTDQSRKAFDLFEVFIFGLVLEAVRREGGDVQLLDWQGNQPLQFLFRSGPGTLGKPTRNYTYAHIEFPGRDPLEAHTGIKVTGIADVNHECDVVVLTKSEAELARRIEGSPDYSKVLLYIECKYYTSGIDIGEGRGFLGLQVDLGKSDSFFVINRNSNNLEKLLQAHRRSVAPRVEPGNQVDIDRLVGYLRKPFQRYASTGKL
jgi:hypothetical protein